VKAAHRCRGIDLACQRVRPRDRLASSPDDWRASWGIVALVAVTGWIPVRRVLTKAVIRLAATRWRGLVTAGPQLASIP